jgi:hypothetical protein
MHEGETWALKRSEPRKPEIAEMHFGVSGLTGHVRNRAIRNALEVYALEEKIQCYKSEANPKS